MEVGQCLAEQLVCHMMDGRSIATVQNTHSVVPGITTVEVFCRALGRSRDKLNIVLRKRIHRNDSFSIIHRMFRGTYKLSEILGLKVVLRYVRRLHLCNRR